MAIIKYCPECDYRTKSRKQQVCRKCLCFLRKFDDVAGKEI